ncbi:MAG: acyl-CoA dehydrogenase family protein, partial [Acidobacteria bacterium]|nr:acyl-CoA dehydrogenase family protein [Acidobacteriota bacterium]
MENASQQKIVDEARDFADREIRPFAGQFEANEAIPRELIDKMAQRGYLSATFPGEYGGLGLDPIYYGYLTEEIGKACASTRGLLTVHTSLAGEALLRWGNKEQKEKWLLPMAQGKKIACFALTEPEVGTDAKSVKTSYRKEGDKYIINGAKKWITYGDVADLFLTITTGEKGITAFIIERDMPGVKTTPIKGLMAGRASHIA